MLYDAVRDEKDACGVGFVADAGGTPSRGIVDAALEALCRVRHRGAVAADALTGDGAGLLLPIPRTVVDPEDSGSNPFGVGMFFLDPGDSAGGRAAIEAACFEEGLRVVRWRPVPVDERALGSYARRSLPAIEQAIVVAPPGLDYDGRERLAFRARRRLERNARCQGRRIYAASLSFETITYKAMCAADQLASFYPDLADERCAAWFAIFHQRYSTNTTTTWERAQPFRQLAHNGEINTIGGNVAWMRSREGHLGAEGLGDDELLQPVVNRDGSDSAMLDEALELLVRAGRDISHAAAMLVPPAWERTDIDPAVRRFFAYHACLLEPWDGPAALVFADGKRVGAALDRNALRPLRVTISADGLVACASEAGAVPLPGTGPVSRSRLGPGQMLCLDSDSGGLSFDAAIKQRLARQRPYGNWLAAHNVDESPGGPVERVPGGVRQRQVAAGVTKEEVTVVLRAMARDGGEPTSSMGDDTAQPPFTRRGRPVFGFLKHRFAQVTNPPIDHLRERHVMSLTTRLGRRPPLLQESPEGAALRTYSSFLLYPSGVEELESSGAVVLDATFDILDGPDGLRSSCVKLAKEAHKAVTNGAELVIVSDRAAGRDRAAVPSALGAGAVHHGLLETGLRSQTSIVADADDVRESHHAACLLTNGCDAVCPRLALESLAELAGTGRLGGGLSSHDAQRRYASALEDGVLKIMSKMGIATVDSYRGAQIIEAVGLDDDVIDLCFSGITSVLGGLSFEELGADVLLRHHDAHAIKPLLANPGFIKHKSGGEYHALNPDVVDALQATSRGTTTDLDEERAAHHLRRAVGGRPGAYERFVSLVNDRPTSEPRDLLETVPAGEPLALEDVEPATAILTRFSTGAMSHGALSSEAHETLSLAMTLIGGKANTGEGGEAPARYRDARNSAIKQVASARFGVTPEYLSFAEELQIKMAQGSKPGEGGQIPGHKVTAEVARLRHTVPGVPLISPPPHHDIYSIEDLAQLIFDLKQANPRAAVSVKLVSSAGVGTIAAGVVKGLADVVHVSGGDGGTGASPLSSIVNAGMPWEIGLAETQAALTANALRGRVRVRVDGGFKTGRDVVIAALLGADEFSFGTAALIAEGCILVRTCHRNTCPVGIATQDPELRKKFAATPEMVARYFVMVAEEVRATLANLGLVSLDDAIGRVELLRQRKTGDVRADSLKLSPLLIAPGSTPRRFTSTGELQSPRSELGDRLFRDAMPAFRAGRSIELRYSISNRDRAVGARLGCAVGQELGSPIKQGQVAASFDGVAGQSFGAFLSDGIALDLKGEANDYVCKGMGGGRVVIRPPAGDAGNPCLVGNTVLYGATAGQLYIAGHAGERFAVRNSGAVAVVEGTGDHACEYMTAGAAVILGPTGRNFGAGMSGGEAYVFDPDATLEASIDPRSVAMHSPSPAQLVSLERVLRRHLFYTGSPIAAAILSSWPQQTGCIRRVVPMAEAAHLDDVPGVTVDAA